MEFLEEITYFRSDPCTLIDIVFPTNSYGITCTNSQCFIEEGENSASSISLEQLDPLFLTPGSDFTLFGSNFKFQYLSVMLVTILISIGVKNQPTQVSFKLVVGDSMLVSHHEFADMKFCDFMDILKAK